MENIVHFPVQQQADMTYTPIKESEPNAIGQFVSLVEGAGRTGAQSYAVVIMASEGATGQGCDFEHVKEFAKTPEGLALAEFAFEVAESTLMWAEMLQTEEGA